MNHYTIYSIISNIYIINCIKEKKTACTEDGPETGPQAGLPGYGPSWPARCSPARTARAPPHAATDGRVPPVRDVFHLSPVAPMNSGSAPVSSWLPRWGGLASPVPCAPTKEYKAQATLSYSPCLRPWRTTRPTVRTPATANG